MKKLIAIITVVALVVASCTSSKNGLLIKRKYNKGYYVSNSHKVNSKSTKVEDVKTETKEIKDGIAAIKIDLPSIETARPEITASVVAPIENQSVKKGDKQIKHNTIVAHPKNTVASIVKTYIKTQAKDLKIVAKKDSKGSSSDSDVNLIIMIILCLFPFINLIPVFIKDGKNFTLNFWITLILDLLFFLPGIIFALLVVLDVVNLA